ncbi:MAG: helix-turn-helix domain-containing protein [Actinomycetota bacterium]|nr:helix-turn-helix domain-containing protein [Actinomycetota bacterium]
MQPAYELSQHDRERAELAAGLRRLRKQRGLTGQQLAESAGMSQSKVSKIETGKVLPSPQDVGVLADALGAQADLRAQLVRQAEDLLSEFTSWRILHRRGAEAKQVAVADVEASSRLVRIFQPTIVPGLLQTAEYARRILTEYNRSDSSDVSAAVAARLRRQELLYDDSRQFAFVLLEGALRTPYGSAATMLGQLDRLVSLTSLSNVELGVVPWSAPLPAAPLHGFCIYDQRLVTVDMMTAEFTVHSAPEITRYEATFAAFRDAALIGPDARAYLRKLADAHKQHR